MEATVKDDLNLCITKNDACAFRIINGSVLVVIGLVGFILSSVTIYSLIWRIKLPLSQNIFILSVSICDELLAIVAVIRGLSIISMKYIGVKDDLTYDAWCVTFIIIANSVWNAVMIVLIPLTLDRFIAVMFTMRYKSLIIKSGSRILVVLSWLPVVGLLIYDTTTYLTGHTTMEYSPSKHRCVIVQDRGAQTAIFIGVPFVAILLMYVVIAFNLFHYKQQTQRFFFTATAIIGTGAVAYIPWFFLDVFKVKMSYKAEMVTTVAIYYINCICNPIIYFYSNRIAQDDLKNSGVGKTMRVITRRFSEAIFETSGNSENFQMGNVITEDKEPDPSVTNSPL